MKYNFKEILVLLKTNMSDIAAECNVSRQAIHHYSSGRPISELTKLKMEAAFNVMRITEINKLRRRIEELLIAEWDI